MDDECMYVCFRRLSEDSDRMLTFNMCNQREISPVEDLLLVAANLVSRRNFESSKKKNVIE